MRNNTIDKYIKKLETQAFPLNKWKIRNGLATLKNDVFFFEPVKTDSKYYYIQSDNNIFKIEKGICIRVVKPNVIRDEQELKDKIEIALFPYERSGEKITPIDEYFLKERYPHAYNYLVKNKRSLSKRDKGKGKYPTWYSYGRTQGMNNFGKKLLIPYIAGRPTAVLSLDEELLFYCGYALFSEDEQELRLLKLFLESEAFWFYIYYTSKPYSKGYMAFAKNYITGFSIPALTDTEKKRLLSLKTKKKVNEFIWGKYGIDEKDIEALKTPVLDR